MIHRLTLKTYQLFNMYVEIVILPYFFKDLDCNLTVSLCFWKEPELDQRSVKVALGNAALAQLRSSSIAQYIHPVATHIQGMVGWALRPPNTHSEF